MDVPRVTEPKAVAKAQRLPVERHLARLFLLALAIGMYLAFLALSRTWIPVADNPQQPPSGHATTQPVVDKEAVIKTPQTKSENSKVVTSPTNDTETSESQSQSQQQSPAPSPRAEQNESRPSPSRDVANSVEQAKPRPPKNDRPTPSQQTDNDSSLLDNTVSLVTEEAGKLFRSLSL